jgi:oligopeptide transport system substrate-binding protein
MLFCGSGSTAKGITFTTVLSRWNRSHVCLVALMIGCAFAANVHAQKALHIAFTAAETTFDPAASDDIPSSDIIRMVFDPPLEYDYHARPVALKPATLAKMPEVSADGRSYVLTVKPGIYFQDDPAFAGKKRELVAADYVYSIKRLMDPKIASPNYYLIENKLVGMKPIREAAEKSGKLDYDREFDGVKALDRYRLQIVFEKPQYEFLYDLASAAFSAVARDVIEKYRDERGRVRERPVGTNAFQLIQSEWKRSSRIVLERFPGYREESLPLAAGPSPTLRVPQLDRIEVQILEEPLPRVLAFQSGELDQVDIPRSLHERVFNGATLKPEYAGKGIRHHRGMEPVMQFQYFNMSDPVVGGTSLEKIALRRAILMAYNSARERESIYKGQAEYATQLIPPTQSGHSKGLNLRPPYDPPLARALLDRFGYKDCDGDGYREAPDCKPLIFTRSNPPDSKSREQDEIWKQSMDAIGIKVQFFNQKWPDLIEMSRTGKLQSWGWGWISSGPGGSGYPSLLVSRNINAINDMQFKDAEYDRLYDLAEATPVGPKRTAIYEALSRIAAAQSVLDFGFHTYANGVSHPWLKNYVRHPFWRTPWKYVDIDVAERDRLSSRR